MSIPDEIEYQSRPEGHPLLPHSHDAFQGGGSEDCADQTEQQAIFSIIYARNRGAI
jgi:hypothetical protein